jgi:hypothetical protein
MISDVKQHLPVEKIRWQFMSKLRLYEKGTSENKNTSISKNANYGLLGD